MAIRRSRRQTGLRLQATASSGRARPAPGRAIPDWKHNKKIHLLSIAVCVALSSAQPGFSQTTSAASTNLTGVTEQLCMKEAHWPLVNSAWYKSASVRTRRQLDNAHSPEVHVMTQVCRALSTSDEAARQQARKKCLEWLAIKQTRTGADAVAHAARIEAICTTFAAPEGSR